MTSLYSFLKTKGKSEKETNLIIAAFQLELELPEDQEKLINEWRNIIAREVMNEWGGQNYEADFNKN